MQKEEAIQRFEQDGRILLPTEAAGEERNLQFCHTMINFDLPWNPQRIEQRVGRLHRIGQTRRVDIFNLSAQGTIEDYLLQILDRKLNMFELVIGEMEMIVGYLTEEGDFEELLLDIWLRSEDEATTAAGMAALMGLLERAQEAAKSVLQDKLMALDKRMCRFRAQDEDRLTDYFDGLERDLQQRLQNAAVERQPGLEEKLQAVAIERAHKMADLAERYTVGVELALLNVLVIQQPKLALAMTVENRSTQTTAYAVWDPLLHRLELLPCAVCGQPMSRLVLCHNGHLAHESCLSPACVDCKRLFCQLCAAEMGECVVCHQALCRHSQITCPTCRRRMGQIILNSQHLFNRINNLIHHFEQAIGTRFVFQVSPEALNGMEVRAVRRQPKGHRTVFKESQHRF